MPPRKYRLVVRRQRQTGRWQIFLLRRYPWITWWEPYRMAEVGTFAEVPAEAEALWRQK